MSDDLDDLLPLFLAEAAERLERLGDLAARATTDSAALGLARRELHALKGAGRMMRLDEFADLCHRTESMLEDPSGIEPHQLISAVDRLVALVGDCANPPSAPGSRASDEATKPESAEPVGPPELRRRSAPVRIDVDLLNHLTDRAARARLLAVAAGGAIERVFELAALAERGVREPLPHQVLATLSTSLRQLGLELETGHRRLKRLSDRQLDALISLQVQPVAPFLDGLARHARELAADLGKQIDVTIDAGESRLDRRILETLQESFLHLVRNAVDHGVETPEARVGAGKAPTGHLRLEAIAHTDRIRIVVEDDGRGVDPDGVRRRAKELGLDVEAAASNDVVQLLLHPGFTTRTEVSTISGRGIGMDAVAATVRGVGGDLWLRSQAGHGLTVTLEVPIVRRGERVVVTRVGRHVIALPGAAVLGFRRVAKGGVAGDGGHAVVQPVSGGAVTAWIPARSFGEDESEGGVLVELRHGGREVAVLVDAIEAEEEVLIRPLPIATGANRLYDGIMMLASGRPAALVSLDAVVADVAPVAEGSQRRAARIRTPARVLLVDDSAVTRAMVRRLLEDGGFRVDSVSSAEEARDRLAHERFDCVVTDIEMPGMDGLELTRWIRGSADLGELPVVVISTRDRPADRRAGLEAGADAYMAKQTLDARELIAIVRRVGSGG